jgi:2,4-dienoyl-CoA reductase-like NADH-dependent reductase (Old Yellow Enzyme family)
MFTSEFDMENRHVKRCFRRMIDRIHAHGSVASASTMIYVPADKAISELYDMSIIPEEVLKPGPECILGRDGKPAPAMTVEEIHQFIDRFARRCAQLKEIGFDMVNIYMSYDMSILAKSLSPIFNQRKDEYGGSFENRARLTLELFQAIKNTCGKDFPIEIQISGREFPKGGYTTEDFVRYCKLCEGLVDIFQIRAWTGDMTHASHYTSPKENPTNLQFAEAFKAAGIQGLCAPVGGFQDLDLIEEFIAQGKTDLVAMARPFICDEEYGIKLLEGRGEDVRPCIHCDNCHQAYCAVNPKIGLQEVWPHMFDAPRTVKRVAVIGGGPAGMEAAITAAQRGHQVTLFEASDHLGGQLCHADYLPEKWSLTDFKNYLIRELEKTDVQVQLNTKAVPGDVEGFDAVIAACGARAKGAPVPVAEGVKVWTPMDVFGHEAELGEHVVVIGGAMTGVDTAFYLLNHGHRVTLLTREREAAHDYCAHNQGAFKELLNSRENLTILTNCQTQEIRNGTIDYTITFGAPAAMPPMGNPDDMPPMPGPMPMEEGPKEPPRVEVGSISFDSVVVSAGREGLVEECFAFAGKTPEFYVAGDANLMSFESLTHGGTGKMDGPTTQGTIRNAMYTAYTAASNL